MQVEVLVPQIGEAVAELILVAWHKEVGDEIEKGDLLFEIDSDKAIVEVEAFVDGTLTQIIAPGESSVMPQQVVAIIETATETDFDIRQDQDALSHAPLPVSNAGYRADAGQESVDPHQRKQRADSQGERARPKISPKARRVAKQAGIDWNTISGSGADGMILVSDVERAIDATSDRDF